MSLSLLDHIAFILLTVVFPIWDYLAIRRRKKRILAGETHLRTGLYKRVIREEWLITAVLLAAWFLLGRDAAAIGFVPRFDALAWIGNGLTVLICAALFWQMATILRKPERREKMRKQLSSLSFLMPHTPREMSTFNAVSVTAGICEEVIFRGFMIAYLMTLLGAPFWVAGLVSSLIFGIAHAYQGPAGIPRTGAVGLMFALLYGLTGSLWAPMVAHAVMDITSGRIGYATTSDETPTKAKPQLDAA